jgi:IS5 family transposase
MNGISDEQAEYFLRDRLTWKRFLGLGLGDAVPDANTIWLFREQLTKAHTSRLMRRPAEGVVSRLESPRGA